MEEAVHFVQEVVEEDGPFDCVIGFSQGASVAAAYIAHCEKDPTVLDLPFRMAVFICAALIPPELAAKSELAKSIQSFGNISVPTVSIVGQRDLCYNQSVALATTCKNTTSQLVFFDGGHHVPKDSGNLKRLALVLERMSRISHARH
ncbi:hypothetical protein ONS95_012514 [Cadophora gregata]|uniref:uncharacterized protein n=1 Tax=Cadophora gregata TaxID=51156 RepID=UPI0026DBF80D|nr:uncharacterized protein ONS95_012514 [Cadophora gregata]KAK0118210.1 hypothetical protein ONS95_012514 [Cadophora gregata]